jgi:hypothetical protein
MNLRKLALSLGILGLFAAPAFAAGNLTGTWTGSMKCTRTDVEGTSKSKVDVTVEINDGEGIQLNLPGTLGLFNGSYVIDDALKPANGVLTGASCSIDNTQGAILRAVVKAKPEDPKGALDGEVLILENDGSISSTTCTIKAKRIDTTVPSLLLCVV